MDYLVKYTLFTHFSDNSIYIRTEPSSIALGQSAVINLVTNYMLQ
jgi:hypothetical protein